MRISASILATLLTMMVVGGAAAETYATKPLREDGIHDPGNDAINVLQEPGEAMIDFPMDRRNQVNWVKTLREGFINPRRSRDGGEFDGEIMQEIDMDIIMKQTSAMPWVRFPHLAHTQWLTCNNCHPKIFQPQYEANPVSMEKILKGQFCGQCHGKVAFSLWTCERCHSVPHDGSAAAFKAAPQ